MKIALVAANGKEGRLIAEEAVRRGHEVTAIVRSENKSASQTAIVKDLFELTAEDLAGFDAVLDAFGAWAPEDLPKHSSSLEHLCNILSNTDTRLLIVGGAGSLFVNPEHTMTLNQTPDFPDAFQPLAAAMQTALDDLRKRTDVKWTYLSPAADFQADGERTGSYQLGGEELMVGSEGPVISYADYAIAMVDLAESGDHIGERVSVVRS
jgi:putative NADH-flavin reductase